MTTTSISYYPFTSTTSVEIIKPLVTTQAQTTQAQTTQAQTTQAQTTQAQTTQAQTTQAQTTQAQTTQAQTTQAQTTQAQTTQAQTTQAQTTQAQTTQAQTTQAQTIQAQTTQAQIKRDQITYAQTNNNKNKKYYMPLPLLYILHIINGIILVIMLGVILFGVFDFLDNRTENDGSPSKVILYTIGFITSLIFLIINAILYGINKNRDDINEDEISSYRIFLIINACFIIPTFIGFINNLISREFYKLSHPNVDEEF